MGIDGGYVPGQGWIGYDGTVLPMTGTFFPPPLRDETQRLQADLSPTEELFERIEQLEARVAELEAAQ